MDPITHSAIGLTVAKAAGNPISLSDPATLCVLAGSVFPDIDILLQKKGDMYYLKNHRGATHSLVGTLISSAVIAAVACLIYGSPNYFTMFLWSLLGCCSHVLFDIFNSSGTKLLWPFTKKKFSLGMLITFDPIFLVLLVGHIGFGRPLQDIFLTVFLLHFAYRSFAWFLAFKRLEKNFGEYYGKITIIPSLKGLYKWHFILEGDDHYVIGEKHFLRNKLVVVKTLKKSDDALTDNIMNSETGEFFKEFSPHFHVKCEKRNETKRYVFTDMRFIMRDRFMYRGVVETDKNNVIVRQVFSPYSSLKKVCITGLDLS